MTLNLALRLVCSIACVGCLACIGALAQTPSPPKDIVSVASVSHGPDTVSSVTVHAHNKGDKDITHLSGILTYTPYGLPAFQYRCSASILEDYVFATDPLLKKFTRFDEHKKPRPKGTLNQGENLDFPCGIQPPTKVSGNPSFEPDMVIFADQTWSGDQRTAQDVFRERKRIAGDYGKLLLAVNDAEKSADPVKSYQEILREWLPKTGIQELPDRTITRQTKEFPSIMPYRRLEAYANQYKWAAAELAAQTAKGNHAVAFEVLVKPYITMMITRDAALGEAYHIHSEAK